MRQAGFLIGVDVGTAGVRAGAFDAAGTLLASGSVPVEVFRPKPDFVEQSSNEIWSAVGAAVKEARARAGLDPADVRGLGFDATCSLVALGEEAQPITVSESGDPEHNVIVWMDHRAVDQADRINATGHAVLRYVGGRISPEQQPPKLKWLKERLPSTWHGARKFLDLADYLTFRATGADVRSACTVVCKWTYRGHRGPSSGWDESFFRQIDLADLFEQDRPGTVVAPVGSQAGLLTAAAADDLGLAAGTPVAVGVIDAHAGGIGSLGMRAGSAEFEFDPNGRLALIGGTSSCHMAVSPDARFIPGVWGPYFGAMMPGMWLNEGGQSATGALVDHLIANHAAVTEATRRARESNATIYEVLSTEVARLRRERPGEEPTADIHVLPYFHGNRSPRADSRARGMVSGLSLDSSIESLALLYLASIQAIACGTRHIIEALDANGYEVRRVCASGGGTRNRLWLEEHADVTGCEIWVAPESDAMLLGSAMLAAVAAGQQASVLEAMRAMSPRAEVIRPRTERKAFLDAKHRVFLRMYEHQQEYRALMEGGSDG